MNLGTILAPVTLASLLALGCHAEAPVLDAEDLETATESSDAPSPEENAARPGEMNDLVETVYELQATFGADNKTDLMSKADVCELIEPVARYGDALIKSGFLIGLEGTLVAGFVDLYGGYDIVWDLYHQQLAVSSYHGSVTTMDEFSVSGTAYVGFVAGLRGGVGDWFGFHESLSLEIGLPYLDDYLSLELTGFRAAVDQNGDGVADVTELLPPPDGVFGYSIGLTLGIDALPDPLPVEVSANAGTWQPHKTRIRAYYERFREATLFGVELPIAVSLVDAADGSACDPDWPSTDEERNCVIQFGKPGTSHTRRSLHLVRSLCKVTHSCGLPLTWPLAGAAVAIAKLRDLGLTPSDLCPDVVTAPYEVSDAKEEPR